MAVGRPVGSMALWRGLSLLGLVAGFAGVGHAQPPGFCALNVSHELVPAPLVEGQVLSARVFGAWPTPGPPTILGVSIAGSDIRVQLEGNVGGATVQLPFWEDTSPVGMLNAGAYDLYVDVTLNPGTASSTTFSCGPTVQNVLTPGQVPVLSPLGLIALAGTLALLAILRISRR